MFATELLKLKVPEGVARCAAGKFVGAYTTAQLAAEELPPGAPNPATIGQQAGVVCAREQGGRT